MGEALYPHAQWKSLARAWDSFYPLQQANEPTRRILSSLEAGIPEFVALLLNHRPASLRGKSLREVMPLAQRQPHQLESLYRAWNAQPEKMQSAPPTLAFAVIGQARAGGKITPEEESNTLAKLLTYWAMRSALDTSAL